jgi:hypothetical protein
MRLDRATAGDFPRRFAMVRVRQNDPEIAPRRGSDAGSVERLPRSIARASQRAAQSHSLFLVSSVCITLQPISGNTDNKKIKAYSPESSRNFARAPRPGPRNPNKFLNSKSLTPDFQNTNNKGQGFLARILAKCGSSSSTSVAQSQQVSQFEIPDTRFPKHE